MMFILQVLMHMEAKELPQLTAIFTRILAFIKIAERRIICFFFLSKSSCCLMEIIDFLITVVIYLFRRLRCIFSNFCDTFCDEVILLDLL